MLIFDSFPTKQHAESFAKSVKDEFKLEATVYDSQEESNKVDIFPFELCPPIVLVERTLLATDENGKNIERKVEATVSRFKGAFAGT